MLICTRATPEVVERHGHELRLIQPGKLRLGASRREPGRRANEVLRDVGWAMNALPWFGKELEETRELMGENFWPYGIEANRKALDALFAYSHEQGFSERRLAVEELFHPSTMELLDPV